MGIAINATFAVESWDERPFDEATDPPKLTHAKVTKRFSGDIDGDSATEWLMAYAEDGSATFVGIERIRGAIAGRTGALVLQHVGTFEDGAARAALTVVPGVGTGELMSVAGGGSFLADPSGSVSLDLTFD
jgi:hypothetical protein